MPTFALQRLALRSHVRSWLMEHLGPPVGWLKNCDLRIATPRIYEKGNPGGGTYDATRWFWNLYRPKTKLLVLVALDHAPRSDRDVVVAQVYVLPRQALRGKTVLCTYRATRTHGTSFLSRFRVWPRATKRAA